MTGWGDGTFGFAVCFVVLVLPVFEPRPAHGKATYLRRQVWSQNETLIMWAGGVALGLDEVDKISP